jgi:hypothetical protein
LTSLPEVSNEDVLRELGIRVAAVLIKFLFRWSFTVISIANSSVSISFIWVFIGLFLEIIQTDFRDEVGINFRGVLGSKELFLESADLSEQVSSLIHDGL